MVFKPSFKCFKNEKNYLYSSDSKTRNFTLSEYIYIIVSYSIFIERFRLCTSSLKNMPYEKEHKQRKVIVNLK